MTVKAKSLLGRYEIDRMDEWDEEARNLMGSTNVRTYGGMIETRVWSLRVGRFLGLGTHC